MPVLFVINPGSTSTKTGLFRDDTCLGERVIRHPDELLQHPDGLGGQLVFRLAALTGVLEEDLARTGLTRADVTAYVGRGGLLHPVDGGTYPVNQAMLDDLAANRYGEHASNLGARIAAALAWPEGKTAYIVDPPSVDEMFSLARYTGLPQIRRRSAFHALNQKAVARRAAAELGLDYDKARLIVAHLGGGISVAAHDQGRVVDVNDALEEGPFSPERAGTLPTLQLLRLAAEHQNDFTRLRRLINGRGGLYAYTGTTDCSRIEEEAAKRPDYRELLQAMGYQIAKAMAALAASLEGRVDALVVTGGLARSDILMGEIRRRVGFVAPLMVYAGEFELQALAAGVLRVLRGEEEPRHYTKEESQDASF